MQLPFHLKANLEVPAKRERMTQRWGIKVINSEFKTQFKCSRLKCKTLYVFYISDRPLEWPLLIFSSVLWVLSSSYSHKTPSEFPRKCSLPTLVTSTQSYVFLVTSGYKNDVYHRQLQSFPWCCALLPTCHLCCLWSLINHSMTENSQHR